MGSYDLNSSGIKSPKDCNISVNKYIQKLSTQGDEEVKDFISRIDEGN